MKGHVCHSPQHLACSSLALLASGAGTTATRKAAGSQATHCPGFTASPSALEYSLRSLCAPNDIRRQIAGLYVRAHEASFLRGLFIHLLSGSEAFLAGAARWRLGTVFRDRSVRLGRPRLRVCCAFHSCGSRWSEEHRKGETCKPKRLENQPQTAAEGPAFCCSTLIQQADVFIGLLAVVNLSLAWKRPPGCGTELPLPQSALK